jgi:hypothetical protein
MAYVEPRLTPEFLEESATQTTNGRGLALALPGVKADAQEMDHDGNGQNRELARRISELLAELKPTDDGVPRFVLGWRLYPNSGNSFWDDAGRQHACGCGCGCHGHHGHK